MICFIQHIICGELAVAADFQTEMSPFGAVYTLLDTWPTEATRAYLTLPDDAACQNQGSAAFGTSKEMLRTMSQIFARVVPVVAKELQIGVSRSTVEQNLYKLLSTMYFSTPIPAIKVVTFLLGSQQSLDLDCGMACCALWL